MTSQTTLLAQALQDVTTVPLYAESLKNSLRILAASTMNGYARQEAIALCGQINALCASARQNIAEAATPTGDETAPSATVGKQNAQGA